MKIFVNELKEDWIIDTLREEWYLHNKDSVTDRPKDADTIWIMSPWVWKTVPKRILKNKFVICTIHHIDFEKFGKKEELDFKHMEQYVNVFHAISNKTEEQLNKLTSKQILNFPFWINQNDWFHISQKDKLREEFKFLKNDYLVGSFQRDTESEDLISPKLIKGPDIFLEIVTNLYKKNSKLKVVLTGKNRNYLINNFEERRIPYVYFEMLDKSTINKLYNLLDLYIVSSRVEGGPRAIFECAITKTPIISTNVGVASQILSPESIYDIENYIGAKPNVEFAYSEVAKYTILNHMSKIKHLFQIEYEKNIKNF